MTRIGNVVIAGAVIGYVLVGAAFGFFTGSNLAGISGLLFGVPVGIVLAVFASTIWLKQPRSRDFVFWWVVSAVMVFYLLALAIIFFLNWKNKVAS